MKKIAPLFAMLSYGLFAQQASTFIHVDQFGYLPESNKVAVISNPQLGYNASESFTPSTLEVRNADDNSLVFTITPAIWNNGQTHNQSGDQGWWADFSNLQEMGRYYLMDTSSNERSAVFEIGEGVYSEILKAAGRMFYYNRCGIEKGVTYAGQWSDTSSFPQDAQTSYIYDQGNTGLFRDMSGGWFDAGDYNKYVTFAHSAVHNLLSAFEENPEAFTDDWNIPESGNGIPDILDELKWELDWLFKMTNEDGSVHIKMGASNYSENAASPPSANTTFPRYYGPTCTSASIAIASMFSHAAKVFFNIEGYSGYSNQLREKAEQCYAYATTFVENNTLETDCDDGSIVAGDADWEVPFQLENYLLASIYLYDITEGPDYNTYIVSHYQTLEPVATSFWGPYKIPLQDALLSYATLANANTEVAQQIKEGFQEAVTNNYEGFFGFSESDLYRAFIPDYSYHWGSSQSKASYGLLNALIGTSGISIENIEIYDAYVDESIHYFHGVNPLGLVFLSNMYTYGAERSVNEIYHGWFNDNTPYDHAMNSPYGPAPGFLSGGANSNFTVSNLTPPFGQPVQKSYLDFNDGFPNNSWEISEPAIYYQAAYVRLLANRVGTQSPGTMENDLDGDGVLNETDECPNTPIGDAVDNEGCTIFSLPPSNYGLTTSNTSCPDGTDGQLEITVLESYTYTASLQSDTFEITQNFDGTTVFENLAQGEYQLCFTLVEQPGYELCFDVNIGEPQPLAVTAFINADKKTVDFELSGGISYTITINGEETTTLESNISLPMESGENQITITAEQSCYGVYEETFFIVDEPLLYPNPLGSELLTISGLEQLEPPFSVQIFDLGGRLVLTENIQEASTSISLDLQKLSRALYVVQLSNLESKYIYKLIK